MAGRYEIRAFIERVRNLDKPELLREVLSVGAAADKRLYGRGSTEARRLGAVEFVRLLNGLAHFLQDKTKPASLSNEEFAQFQPIIRILVEKGQMKPSDLDVFKSPSP